MKKITFILAMLFCPNLFAATLTANTVPYVCQGGASPQLCNSNMTTDSNGNLLSGVSIPYIKVSNSQALGTGGGAATPGGWQTMPLTTRDIDTDNIATLTNNQITLPAGTYTVSGTSPFYVVGHAQIRLQDITTSTTLLTGTSCYGQPTGDIAVTDESNIIGQIVLSTTSTLVLQYQTSTSDGSSDLGVPAGFGKEVYAQIEFTKIS